MAAERRAARAAVQRAGGERGAPVRMGESAVCAVSISAPRGGASSLASTAFNTARRRLDRRADPAREADQARRLSSPPARRSASLASGSGSAAGASSPPGQRHADPATHLATSQPLPRHAAPPPRAGRWPPYPASMRWRQIRRPCLSLATDRPAASATDPAGSSVVFIWGLDYGIDLTFVCLVDLGGMGSLKWQGYFCLVYFIWSLTCALFVRCFTFY